MVHEFEDYLRSKKIDPEAFRANEPETYNMFRSDFLHLHPSSFTMQKLFYINIIRRKYTYKTPERGENKSGKSKPVVATKVKMAPKIKSKPTAARPVMKPKAENDISGTGKKPVMKPRIPEKPADEKTKKQARPVVKPVIKPKPADPIASKENHGPEKAGEAEKKQTPKPKMNRPLIKSKIPKPKKDD